MATLRDEQLEALMKLARAKNSSMIVVGDLNTANFSPYFRDLLVTVGLRGSRQVRGIQASRGPLPLIEIAIDHCLISPELAIVNRRVGSHLGSDHRPVIADLRLPAPSQKT